MDFQFTYWKDHPTKKGFVTLDRTCTYNELKEAVENHLKSIPHTDNDGDACTLYDLLDYIHISVRYDEGAKNIPEFCRIYCWVTEGCSEGHYFHVECSTSDGKTTSLLLAKTLSGCTDIALLINNEISRFILSHRL